MLTNRRLTIIGDSVVDDVQIASFGAVLNFDGGAEVSLTSRYIDKEACKIHRDIVRRDQADFEDMVYDFQDKLKE